MAGRAVGYGGEALPGSVVAAALRRVVALVDPDLGFRLFLRALAAPAVPLTREQFAGYAALGERIRYDAARWPQTSTPADSSTSSRDALWRSSSNLRRPPRRPKRRLARAM